jgi:TonB family protein
MICGSCERRVDPNRSFCTHCGSSVFIDERDVRPRAAAAASQPPQASSTFLQSLQDAAKSLQESAKSVESSKPFEKAKSIDRAALARKAQAVRSSAARASARATAAKRAAPSFSLAPLIRLAIFVWIMWYVGGWLLRIPEVLVLKDRMQAGHFSDDDLKAARDAIGERIQTFVRNSQDPNPPPRVSPPAEKTVEAPAPARPRPRERGDGVIRPPTEVDSVPPGVSLPGNGVSLPRILQSAKPVYTLDALRAKGEGTVLLQAVVRTHGVATNISVVRSLDPSLDERAMTAVKQWRFAPGERAGQPVPVLVQIAVPFLLQ